LALGGTFGGAFSAEGAYPRPAFAPFRWELRFEPGDLRMYYDRTEGKAYWYFSYLVTNLTGADQMWAPSMVLFTDAGEILDSGQGVPSQVTEDIRTFLGNALLETQDRIIGDIRQGKAHAREGLAVWPVGSLDVNEISLFIGGISGETARIAHPTSGEAVIMRKTLKRNYLIRGMAAARTADPAELVSEEWVMR